MSKKKNLITIIAFIALSAVYPLKVHAINDFISGDNDENIDRVIEIFEPFRDVLDDRQEAFLITFEQTIENERTMNNMLRLTGGDFSLIPRGASIESQIRMERFADELKLMDALFLLRESRNHTGFYLYSLVSSNDFYIPEAYYYKVNNPNILDNTKVEHLREFYRYGFLSDFLIGSATGNEPQVNGQFKVRIKVPERTPLVQVNNAIDNLIINRNMGLEIESIRRITDRGREVLRVEANLISKEEVDKKIQKVKNNIDTIVADKIGDKYKLIAFDLSGKGASLISEQAEQMVSRFIDVIPLPILKEGISFMGEKGANIVLTDKKLGYVREALPVDILPSQEEKVFNEANRSAGRYNPYKRTIVINGHARGIVGNHMDPERLLHEFGHVVDNMRGQGYSDDNLSNSAEFKVIFNEERDKLTEYGKTNIQEFFAEAFRLTYSTNLQKREHIKESAPKSYEFITKIR
ncbi:anthrax toxin lethal factor-related metalloendopeptidase [Enterococcus sp. 5H]|uniref:anthrax toxin lethal factor-related metalloendopeptidase n=1 Tax=Enterococcus sp. 5H TaxID=1229490 RepID=UPI0023046DDC|nr:hypothetical protein [Enterococcus sp. 5H]